MLCKPCKNVDSHMIDALSMLKIHGVSRMKYQVCVKLKLACTVYVNHSSCCVISN